MKKVLMLVSVLFFTCALTFAVPNKSDVNFFTVGNFSYSDTNKISRVTWSTPTGTWCVYSVSIVTSTGQVSTYNVEDGKATITWNGKGRHEASIVVVFRNSKGIPDVVIKRNPHVNLIGIKSLLPSEGEKISSDSASCDVYVIQAEKNKKISVVATPEPSDIGQNELPSDWAYTGLPGNSKLSRNASIDNAKDYDISVTCGTEKKCIQLRVYEPKKGPIRPTATISAPGGDAYKDNNGKWHVPNGGKLILKGTEGTDTDILVFADGTKYKDVQDYISDHVWIINAINGVIVGREVVIESVITANNTTQELNIFYAGKDKYSSETVLDKFLSGNLGNDHSDYSQLASIKIIVDRFADVDSIKLTDQGEPGRNSSARLEVVGSQKVRMQAFKADYKWQTSHPKWTFPNPVDNKVGEDIVHNFTNTSVPLNTLIVTGGLKYEVSAKGNVLDTGKNGIVVVYPSGSAALEYDFGKYGDDVKKALKKSKVFKPEDLEKAINLPNGKISISNSWEELTDSPLAIWAVSLDAGLDPLLGIEGSLQLLGPPKFITKYVGAKAGLFLKMSGNLKLIGTIKRDKDNPNGTGEVVLSGTIGSSVHWKLRL